MRGDLEIIAWRVAAPNPGHPSILHDSAAGDFCAEAIIVRSVHGRMRS
jgi:hypothetical protein